MNGKGDLIMTHEEECGALKLIADSQDGITETVLATHSLAGDLLAGLVADGLVASETVCAMPRTGATAAGSGNNAMTRTNQRMVCSSVEPSSVAR
jgi:hypothetical protein